MDRTVAVKAGLLQAAGVALLSLALGLALPTSFFQDWGILAGPGAWMLIALATALAVRVPVAGALIGAALAGVPSGLAVVIGVHWAGAVVAVILFALWCGRLAVDRELAAEVV